MHDPTLFAVIMAGGSGTRFWPASRRERPKQFLSVGGDRALLAQTYERLDGLVEPERVLVVSSQAHAEQVRATLPDLPAENLLAEPHARNTAPCVAWAAWEIERRDPHSIQLVLPADHVIPDREQFQQSVRTAARHAAENDALCCFGIQPTFPATGFGYIEPGAVVDGEMRAVKRFVEKPDAKTAERFVALGHLWNAGIFLWSTASIRSATARHLAAAEAALSEISDSSEIERVWSRLPAKPVDVAIMEQAQNVHVLPVSYVWNDIGSWTALPEILPADSEGNVVTGGAQLISKEARDCIVYGDKQKLIGLIGVEGLVVVQSGDALLVCPKERAQEVKAIVERLDTEGPEFL